MLDVTLKILIYTLFLENWRIHLFCGLDHSQIRSEKNIEKKSSLVNLYPLILCFVNLKTVEY